MATEALALDPKDPRAPTQAQWDAMTEAERALWMAALPSDMPWELHPPEGDSHRGSKDTAREALIEHFRRKGRRVYVSSELVTYYPGQPRFAPDILAVVDVDLRPRESWVVSAEGRGLDFVLEIRSRGDVRKDFEERVERYASLGIPEYFAFDCRRGVLWGWKLTTASARTYERIVPQGGRLPSEILRLELMVEQGRVRFYDGNAPLLFVDELVVRLEQLVDGLIDARDAATRRAEEEARRAEEEARRAEEEARRAEEQSMRADGEARRAEDFEKEVARLRKALARYEGTEH